MTDRKKEEMNTLETKTLLGYTLEIFEMTEFKEYYDEHTGHFNDFSRSAFLKSISIPPSYFLEQPAETQEELLNNKLELVKVQKKYAGMSILVVSQGSEILNATKIKTNEVEMKYETISSIEDVKDIVWNRPLVKEGYICGYLVCGTVTREGYNRVLNIDLPILFNKPTMIHEGFMKLANNKMKVEKDMIYYSESEKVDYDEYQHIALAIEDKMEALAKDDTLSIDKEEPKLILRESLEVVCKLIEEKVLPKSLLFHVVGFIDEQIEEGKTLTNARLLESIIAFDQNVKSLKHINSMRSCKGIIEELFNSESEDE